VKVSKRTARDGKKEKREPFEKLERTRGDRERGWEIYPLIRGVVRKWDRNQQKVGQGREGGIQWRWRTRRGLGEAEDCINHAGGSWSRGRGGGGGGLSAAKGDWGDNSMEDGLHL